MKSFVFFNWKNFLWARLKLIMVNYECNSCMDLTDLKHRGTGLKMWLKVFSSFAQ